MPLHEDAQKLVDEFGRQPGVTPDQLRNLQNVINASPALTDEINTSVAGGHLTRIMPDTDPHDGGSYDSGGKTMNLQLASLTSPSGGAKFDSGEATFVLGHELQHSLNGPITDPAETKFSQDVDRIAKSPGPHHDYTAAVRDYVAASRRDEASAEVSGWNAIVSAARKDADANHKPLSLQDIYNRSPDRMGDFIDVDRSHVPNTYAIKPNLTLNADKSMDLSAHNIEGMGKNYFDKALPAPNGLGQGGNADYQNYYGSNALAFAATQERALNPPHPGTPSPTMQVDMRALRMNPRTIEDVGMDLGSNHNPIPYQDTSTHPPTSRQFTHTAAAPAHSPITHDASAAGPQLNEPAHPNHALFNQVRDAVHHMDTQQNRSPDQHSENLAGAITVEVAKKGMTGVQSVHLNEDGSKVYAVQGDLNSPFKQMAEVNTVQAINTPIAQSTNAMNQVTQQQTAQGQQQSQQPNPQMPPPQDQQTSHGMAPH